jgi:hypothetical protein
MTNPKYDIPVELTGLDGNAFAILGRIRTAMKKAGVPQQEINEFFEEAMSEDYDHLLRTAAKWVNVK